MFFTENDPSKSNHNLIEGIISEFKSLINLKNISVEIIESSVPQHELSHLVDRVIYAREEELK
jgi:hypothetical protein